MNENNLKKTNFKGLYGVVIASVVIPAITFCVSLAVGYKSQTVNSTYTPFVSEAGDQKPNSSIFTLGLSLSGMMTMVIIIIRFYQVKFYFTERNECFSRINNFSLICGITLVFGEFIVAAFQLSNITPIHFLGAGMNFLGAVLYCGTQCYFTSQNPKTIFFFRVISTVTMAFSSMVFVVFMVPPLTRHNRNGENIAQTFEWILVTCQLIFMLTFLYDFRRLEVEFRFKQIDPQDSDNDKMTQDFDNGKKTFLNFTFFNDRKDYETIN
ncbi:transmembrane protein 150A [Hydra vulgaris]|uniref:transmembrane protein 150A n=1 Tax=Hydra vulgaris TaxID=6087 RepID=UPI001F5FF02B|nr:transmembrane protein 150A [Hydra vulgaris]